MTQLTHSPHADPKHGGHEGRHSAPPTDAISYTATDQGARRGRHPNKLKTTPRWPYAALALLVTMAGGTYAYGIKLGLVHDYYSSAVYSMSQSWSAFLWGAVDGSTITLDKLPGAFWIQALSVRMFGFNDWALLLPQTFEALGALVLGFFTVRRWADHSDGLLSRNAGNIMGLLAAAGVAVTPIVASLAHTEISDIALMFFLTLAAYTWTRAMENGSWKWLAWTGFVVGCAFQTKMAEAWGILPALALTYLIFAKSKTGKAGWIQRLWHTLVAGAVAAISSMWWIILVSIVPASSRPWIDGSADNSAWSMVFEYNLSGRYEESGSGMGNSSGNWSYLLGGNVASQAGWFYATAVIGLLVALWFTRKAARSNLLRAAALMSGLWFATYFVAFSIGHVNHSYYVVAMAPGIAMLAALGVVTAWQTSKWLVALMAVATATWTIYLSNQFTTFMPITRAIVVVALVAGLIALALSKRVKLFGPIAAIVLTLGALATPAVWAASTTQASYSGSAHGPVAGPVSSMGGGSGSGRSGMGGSSSSHGGRSGMGGPEGSSGGSADGSNSSSSRPTPPSGADGSAPSGAPSNSGTGQSRSGQSGSSQGGPGSRSSSSNAEAVLEYIRANDPGSEYDLVVTGYSNASDYITAGGKVIFAGGYSGNINNLTLDELKDMVANGEVTYIQLGGSGRGGGSLSTNGESSAVDEITQWVQENFTAVTDAGVSNLYKLTTS